MKRLLLLSTVFLILLSSCALTHDFMVGERYAADEPKKVLLFRGPSFDSEALLVELPREFAIEGVECPKRATEKGCPYELKGTTPKYLEDIFYRVRLDEETAYLSSRYIFDSKFSGALIALGPRKTKRFGEENAFEVKAGFDKMWETVIKTVHEYGYTISQLKKAEGYISTHTKSDGKDRSRLSIWVSTKGDLTRVEINATSESKIRIKVDSQDRSYWERDGMWFFIERGILEEIREKLWLSKASK